MVAAGNIFSRVFEEVDDSEQGGRQLLVPRDDIEDAECVAATMPEDAPENEWR